jgi:ferrous iron transport protein A
MFTQSFTVSGSSLELLKMGEQGIVTSCKTTDETIINKLIAMGITPGISIRLEQQFPFFVIKVGHSRLVLDKEIARTLYVRIVTPQKMEA